MKNAKLLLDEMYSGLKPFLKILGWEAQSVDELGLKGAEDAAIVEYASRNSFIIVTQDQVIADLARLKGVRYVLVGLVEISRVVDKALRDMAVRPD
jgi:predicted nuclease of predicted toxin-antitoxin system